MCAVGKYFGIELQVRIQKLAHFLFSVPFGCSRGDSREREREIVTVGRNCRDCGVTDSKGRNSCAVNPSIPFRPFYIRFALCFHLYWTNSFRTLIHTLSLHPPKAFLDSKLSSSRFFFLLSAIAL